MKMDVRQYGDPILRAKAKPIAKVDDAIRKLAADMIETMRGADGCGLAAQQVGLDIAICVIEAPATSDADDEGAPFNPGLKMPMIVINPEITELSRKTHTSEEGCLSFPEIRGNIERARDIKIRFLNELGEPRELDIHGFAARVIQHEIDHLNGVLFIDRMSAPKRIAISGKLKKLKKVTGEKMGI